MVCKAIALKRYFAVMAFLFTLGTSMAKIVTLGQNVGEIIDNEKISRPSTLSGRKSPLNPRGQCSAEIGKLENRLQQIVDVSELNGHWVSKSCEMITGPKFILRDYLFYKSGNFLLRQYEYSDEQCTKPIFGFTVDGHVIHLAASWSVPGGTSTTFTLNKVNVVPYSKMAAVNLTVALRRKCSHIEWPWLVEYNDYPLYYKKLDHYNNKNNNNVILPDLTDDYSKDYGSAAQYFDVDAPELDCMSAVNFSMTTLNLLRMDEISERLEKNEDGNKKVFFEKRLYFGKSVYDAKNSTYITPSSFLEPLVNVDEAPTCRACERIKNANQISPPKLRTHTKSTDSKNSPSFHPAVDHLHGDWLSTTCESYMHGSYGYRLMSFRGRRVGANSRRWKLRHRYFDDPLCRHPSYTLIAGGEFSAGTDNDKLSLTQNLMYKIEKVKLIPESKRFAENMKSSKHCGPAQRWAKGRSVDLTSSGGCSDLGIRVPIVIKDIVRIVYDQDDKKLLLYNGDYTTVEYGGEIYPSAFQQPLSKCETFSIKLYVHTTSLNGDKNADVKNNSLHYLHMKLSTSNCGQFCFCYILLLTLFLITCLFYNMVT